MSVYGTLAGIAAIIPDRRNDVVKESRDDWRQDTTVELKHLEKLDDATPELIRRLAENIRKRQSKRDLIELAYMRAWATMKAPTRWTSAERALTDAIREALTRLDPETRSLLDDYAGGMSIRTIADDRDIPRSTTGRRIKDAIDRMKPKTNGFNWPRTWLDALQQTSDEMPHGRTDRSFPNTQPRLRSHVAHIHIRTTVRPGWRHYAPQTETASASMLVGSEHADEITIHNAPTSTDHDAQTRIKLGILTASIEDERDAQDA